MKNDTSRKTIKADVTLLKKQIDKLNIPYSQISDQMGYEYTYISNLLARNTDEIPATVPILLDKLFSISYDSYKIQEPKVIKETTNDPLITEMSQKELYKLIYSAVYHAVKKAWAE